MSLFSDVQQFYRLVSPPKPPSASRDVATPAAMLLSMMLLFPLLPATQPESKRHRDRNATRGIERAAAAQRLLYPVARAEAVKKQCQAAGSVMQAVRSESGEKLEQQAILGGKAVPGVAAEPKRTRAVTETRTRPVAVVKVRESAEWYKSGGEEPTQNPEEAQIPAAESCNRRRRECSI